MRALAVHRKHRHEQQARRPHHHNIVNLRAQKGRIEGLPPTMPLPRVPVAGDTLVIHGNKRVRVRSVEMGSNFIVAYVSPA